MNNVTSADKNKNISICPVDETGAPIKPHYTEVLKSSQPENIIFKAWIESLFDSQEQFGSKVGYSRQSINEFCNGAKPIPPALLLIMKLSIHNAELKQENSRLRRKSTFKARVSRGEI